MTNICAKCSNYFTNPKNIKTKIYCSLKCKKSAKDNRNKERNKKYQKEYQNKWRKNNPNYNKEWREKNYISCKTYQKRKKKKQVKSKKIKVLKKILKISNLRKCKKNYESSYHKWKLNNPEKVKAHKLVYCAIRNKTLIRGICVCGSIKVEAHHEDYLKPLDVVWVCKKHHAELDKIRRCREKELPTV